MRVELIFHPHVMDAALYVADEVTEAERVGILPAIGVVLDNLRNDYGRPLSEMRIVLDNMEQERQVMLLVVQRLPTGVPPTETRGLIRTYFGVGEVLVKVG